MQTDQALLVIEISDARHHWQRDPKWMAAFLAAYAEELRGQIVAASGALTEMGDLRMVAQFPDASSAYRAALDIRLIPSSLRPKMVIHFGRADQIAGIAPRLATLAAGAHGDQILITERAHQALRTSFPEDSFVDLGEYRLTGWTRSRHLFQAGQEAPGPLTERNLLSPPNNLAPKSTTFVGRQVDLIAIRDRRGLHRLVTLVAPGGTGKTRLAVQAALDSLPDHAGGVWFVDLAVVSDDELVEDRIAQTVFPDEPGPTLDDFLNRNGAQVVLLVLDNCEHVLAGARNACLRILERTAGVGIMATSREPLDVPGEDVYLVAPLAMPAGPIRANELGRFEAPRLFLDRVALVQPDFRPTDEDVEPLLGLCDAVSRNALALEIAAAYLPRVPLSELSKDLRALSNRPAPDSERSLPRRQTLHGLIDWSYRMLPREEKQIFRRIAVFEAYFLEADAVELLSRDPLSFHGDDKTLTGVLAQLVEKSVLSRTGDRMRLEPVIRNFALSRLRESGEEDTWRLAHCDLCASRYDESEFFGRTGESGMRIRASEIGEDDFRAALRYAIDRTDITDAALWICARVGVNWYQRGYRSEVRRWLVKVLRLAKQPGRPRSRMGALSAAIAVSGFEGDHTAAAIYCEELESLARRENDDFFLATVLNEQGKLDQYASGDPFRARAKFEQAHAIFEALPGCEREANFVTMSLGAVASATGEIGRAIALFRQSIDVARRTGDAESLGYGYGSLAITLYDSGDYEGAAHAYEIATKDAQTRGLRTLELNHQNLSGRLYLDWGKHERGKAGYEAALGVAVEIGDRHRELLARAGLARAYAAMGDSARSRSELSLCWAASLSEKNDQMRVEILFAGVVLASGEGRFAEAAQLLGLTYAVREGIAWAVPPAECARWAAAEARLLDGMNPDELSTNIAAGRKIEYDWAHRLLF